MVATGPIRDELLALGKTRAAAYLAQVVEGVHFPPVQEVNGQPYARWLDVRAVADGLEIVIRNEQPSS